MPRTARSLYPELEEKDVQSPAAFNFARQQTRITPHWTPLDY